MSMSISYFLMLHILRRAQTLQSIPMRINLGIQTFSYNDYCDDYPIYNQTIRNNEYTNQRATTGHTQRDGELSSSFYANPGLQSNHHPGEHLHVWEDNVDLDNMTYEELIELGEIVGNQRRGLSHEAISLLPISKFKFWFFWRKKSKDKMLRTISIILLLSMSLN